MLHRMTSTLEQHDAMDIAGRVGLVAYGVVHLIVGWLALQLAFGEREGKASSSGAIKQLAEQPMGGFLVWAVAIGMFLLAIWRVLDAILGHATDDDSDRLKAGAVGVGKAVLYVAVGISAVRVATGSASGGGGGTESTTAKVMDVTGGQLIVGAAGLAVIGYGGWLIYTAWSERFLKKIDGKDQGGNTGTAFKWLGKAGYAAKGVSIGVIGALFVYAAATHEPKKSGGLDEALHEVLDQPFGPVLLTLVALGIIAYGLFAFARAKQDSPS
jgi:type IV secretory pathway VirB2 component (pilin)